MNKDVEVTLSMTDLGIINRALNLLENHDSIIAHMNSDIDRVKELRVFITKFLAHKCEEVDCDLN